MAPRSRLDSPRDRKFAGQAGARRVRDDAHWSRGLARRFQPLSATNATAPLVRHEASSRGSCRRDRGGREARFARDLSDALFGGRPHGMVARGVGVPTRTHALGRF